MRFKPSIVASRRRCSRRTEALRACRRPFLQQCIEIVLLQLFLMLMLLPVLVTPGARIATAMVSSTAKWRDRCCSHGAARV